MKRKAGFLSQLKTADFDATSRFMMGMEKSTRRLEDRTEVIISERRRRPSGITDSGGARSPRLADVVFRGVADIVDWALRSAAEGLS